MQYNPRLHRRRRRRHCHRRPRHRDRLLTGSRGRLTILAVVAEEVDVVADVSRPKIRDLVIRFSDGLRFTSDILDARQGTECTSVGHFVPTQIVSLFLRVAAATEQPTDVIVAAHTFRDDLLDEVAGNRKEIADLF